MDVLILGGTGFASKEAALSFMRAGHRVVCAARGMTGSPPDGARFIAWDRHNEPPPELIALSPDVVVDVSTTPSQVARACELFPESRWLYISTISVYPAMTEPLGTPDTTPVHEPVGDGAGMEAYGGMKIACENAVRQLSDYLIVRPGLIVGPGDPSGRFTYWPARLAAASQDGLPYIAPLPADDPVQWIDVRDLADWLVHLPSRSEVGVVEAIGPSVPRTQFLADMSTIFDPEPEPAWMSADDLESAGIGFWSGDRAIPLWLPEPSLTHMLNRDPAPARALGLVVRPVASTAQDIVDSTIDRVAGLSREDEIAVLRGAPRSE